MRAWLSLGLVFLFAGCLGFEPDPDAGDGIPVEGEDGTDDGNADDHRISDDVDAEAPPFREPPTGLPDVPGDAPLAPLPDSGPFAAWAIGCSFESREDVLVTHANGTFYHITVDLPGHGAHLDSGHAMHMPAGEAELVVRQLNETGLFNLTRVTRHGDFEIEWAAKRQLGSEEFRVLRARVEGADFPHLNATYHDPHLLDGCGAQVGAWSEGYRTVDTYATDGPDGLARFVALHRDYLWRRPG